MCEGFAERRGGVGLRGCGAEPRLGERRRDGVYRELLELPPGRRRGDCRAFPPLAGNPTVSGNPVAVIAIVQGGLEGRLVVNGQAYSGIMPRWRGVLSDEQIAAVISYVRSSWKNNAPGVSVSDVQAVK